MVVLVVVVAILLRRGRTGCANARQDRQRGQTETSNPSHTHDSSTPSIETSYSAVSDAVLTARTSVRTRAKETLRKYRANGQLMCLRLFVQLLKQARAIKMIRNHQDDNANQTVARTAVSTVFAESLRA